MAGVDRTRRGLLRGGAAAGAALLFAPALVRNARASSRPLGVVELFTSQGCSSCPPADAALAEMIAGNEALCLAHHVDYWDYLGWKDSLGRAEATKRQYAYATTFGRRGVYTPQAVVNGQSHHVGSRAGEVRKALTEQSLHTQPNAVDVSVALLGDSASVTIQGPAAASADVYAFAYDLTHREAIERGENRGRTIVYHHPVRKHAKIGEWAGRSATVEIEAAGLLSRPGLAVLVQRRTEQGTPGVVLGAAALGMAS